MVKSYYVVRRNHWKSVKKRDEYELHYSNIEVVLKNQFCGHEKIA